MLALLGEESEKSERLRRREREGMRVGDREIK